MSTLDRAIGIAVEAHAGQTDKAGEPYILHPLRVMLRMSTQDERIVAVLHDVVEDSAWTLEALAREGFSQDVVDAVGALTHEAAQTYDAYLADVRALPLAAAVKRADLQDNLDPDRLRKLSAETAARARGKYTAALDALGGIV